jgi:hypothetical protein
MSRGIEVIAGWLPFSILSAMLIALFLRAGRGIPLSELRNDEPVGEKEICTSAHCGASDQGADAGGPGRAVAP